MIDLFGCCWENGADKKAAHPSSTGSYTVYECIQYITNTALIENNKTLNINSYETYVKSNPKIKRESLPSVSVSLLWKIEQGIKGDKGNKV